MKKTLTAVIIALTVMACQKKAAEIETPKNAISNIEKDSICINLDEYHAINDDSTRTDEEKALKKAEWLRSNGANVCKKYLDEALEGHLITPGQFTAITTKPFAKSREDIEKVISGANNYEKYIAFDIDAQNAITKMYRVDNFTINPICYSIPLLQYIFVRHQVGDIDELKFHVVNVNGKKTIVIEVVDSQSKKTFYYDFSNEPSFTPFKIDPKK